MIFSEPSVPSPLPTVAVNTLKDWLDYVAVFGGILAALGAIAAVVVTVLGLRAQERANVRAIKAERRASKLDLYQDMLDYLSSSGRHPDQEDRIASRVQRLADQDVLAAWEKFRGSRRTRQEQEAAAEGLESLVCEKMRTGEQQDH